MQKKSPQRVDVTPSGWFYAGLHSSAPEMQIAEHVRRAISNGFHDSHGS